MQYKAHIKIGGVETFSSVDFPSHMSAAVFMQGCPWRCPFCYNTALQPTNADTDFVWEKFYEFLKTRRGILDAVVFSGGEPLMQDALLDAIDEVKALGYLAAVHTGGYRPGFFAEVLEKTDWVGFDIKAPLEEEKYNKAIGFKNTMSLRGGEADVAIPANSILPNVLQSLDLLLKSNKNFECRTTCDPNILTIQDIYSIADSLHARGVKNYHLQRYKPVKGNPADEFECDKFIQDKDLAAYLRAKFASSELRS